MLRAIQHAHYERGLHVVEPAVLRGLAAGGFPAFALEIDGSWYAVPHQQFASVPAGFAGWLRKSLNRRP